MKERDAQDPDAPPPGVRPIDHTADIGIGIRAASLAELFDRAALGLTSAMFGATAAPDQNEDRDPAGQQPAEAAAPVELEARDAELLLVDWLREVLLLAESGRCYEGATFDVLTQQRLVARIRLRHCPRAPVREIKGVTYHGLQVRRSGSGWRASVVFDV